NRLETMALMSKVELPLHALRAQVASAIDVVVQLNRQIGGNRLVTEIAEVLPLGEDGQYHLQNMFLLQRDEEAAAKKEARNVQLLPTGVRSTLAGDLDDTEEEVVTDLTRELFTPE
ncbi:MAG: hypothetical protein R3336_05935, partial [Phycisphaeraceae bacterium]|nr:hypothetical protein [Phycisphaeraceae bacterium]